MRELGELIIREALKEGADEAEAYVEKRRVLEAKADGPELRVTSRVEHVVHIRVSVGKKVAALSLTSADPGLVREEVRKALSIARARPEDPHWSGFADPTKPSISEVFDKRISELGLEDLARMARSIIEHVRSMDSRLLPARTSLRVVACERMIMNSRGVEAPERMSVLEVFEWVKASGEGKESTEACYEAYRSMPDEEEILGKVEEAGRKALDGLKARKLTGKYSGPAVIAPRTLAELLYYALAPAFSAAEVQEGRSPLAGKLGEKVFSEELTIVDDGCLPGGVRTSVYDAEGVARRRTTLVERGVLRGYLYDTYTARRDKVESTGNAERRGADVTVMHSNLVIQPGKASLEELIAEVGRGLLLDGMLMSAHTVNAVTGDFSVVVTHPYVIEGGEVREPLQPMVVGGNIYDVLSGARPGAPTRATVFAIYAPPMILPRIVATAR